MILLDTNVISEPLRSQPNPRVAQWIDAQIVETLYVAAISLAELRYGIGVHPDGKKKRAVEEKLERLMLPLFRGRVLSFDEASRRSLCRTPGCGGKERESHR